jgi:hypothetical protein
MNEITPFLYPRAMNFSSPGTAQAFEKVETNATLILKTAERRAYEYGHQYGVTLYGKAVSSLLPADVPENREILPASQCESADTGSNSSLVNFGLRLTLQG